MDIKWISFWRTELLQNPTGWDFCIPGRTKHPYAEEHPRPGRTQCTLPGAVPAAQTPTRDAPGHVSVPSSWEWRWLCAGQGRHAGDSGSSTLASHPPAAHPRADARPVPGGKASSPTHPTATHPSPPGPPVDAPREAPILPDPSACPTAAFRGWGALRSQPPPNLVTARPASRWHGFRKLGRAGEAQQKALCFSCLVPAPLSHLPGGVTFPRKSLQWRAGSDPGRMRPQGSSRVLSPSLPVSHPVCPFPGAVELRAVQSTACALSSRFKPCLHGKVMRNRLKGVKHLEFAGN